MLNVVAGQVREARWHWLVGGGDLVRERVPPGAFRRRVGRVGTVPLGTALMNVARFHDRSRHRLQLGRFRLHGSDLLDRWKSLLDAAWDKEVENKN